MKGADAVLIKNAVVGFVDIVSSTKLCNVLDLPHGFELKRRFHEAAVNRAAEQNLTVLNHTGDGFLFIANSTKKEKWADGLINFHSKLIDDYDLILSRLSENPTLIETGLRFGASRGPVIIGRLASGQNLLTAVGPDVNLAARFCSVAGPGEFVVSYRVWDELKGYLKDVIGELRVHRSLKGFEGEIQAIHFRKRSELARKTESSDDNSIVTEHSTIAG